MLTSVIRPVFIAALATGSIAIAAAGGPAFSQDPSGVATFRPIEGISYQLGSKRAVGYFEPRNGKCQVALMIVEAVDPDHARLYTAARLSLAMLPGQSTVLATEEGTRWSSLAAPAPRPSPSRRLTGERITASISPRGWAVQ